MEIKFSLTLFAERERENISVSFTIVDNEELVNGEKCAAAGRVSSKMKLSN